jgi:hypothetical protein
MVKIESVPPLSIEKGDADFYSRKILAMLVLIFLALEHVAQQGVLSHADFVNKSKVMPLFTFYDKDSIKTVFCTKLECLIFIR